MKKNLFLLLAVSCQALFTMDPSLGRQFPPRGPLNNQQKNRVAIYKAVNAQAAERNIAELEAEFAARRAAEERRRAAEKASKGCCSVQ